MSTHRRARNRTIAPAGAFESFYRAHYGAISRYVARRVPATSHDDVVAKTFVVAWSKFAEIHEPTLPWLYRIASYEVAHERRQLVRHPQDAELNDLDLIDTSPLEDVFDVSRAFSQLSESDAELLRLVYWDDLSRSDVAAVLGTSTNAVNVRVHRAVERLAGALSRLAHVTLITESSPKENP